jgi:hypothetical protein
VLFIAFQSSTSRPDQSDTRRRAALPTRVVLPAVTSFTFQGTGEYLEDFLAQVEAPRLKFIKILCLNQLILYVPQVFRFVGQAQLFEQARKGLRVIFNRNDFLSIHLRLHVENDQVGVSLSTHFCHETRGLLSDLASLLSRCSVVLSNVGRLSIDMLHLCPSWQDDVATIECLELLRQLTAVETLIVSAPLSGYMADVLEGVAVEMAPEILPALRLLCLENQQVERVEGFVGARQLSTHPVTVVNQRNGLNMSQLSYCP